MTGEGVGAMPREAHTVAADILVVDDELDIRRSVSEVLRTAGFTVAEAEDGDVAFGLLSTHRYGMILLDIRMPARDGVSLVEALREVPPVVVHSAYSLGEEERARLGGKVVRYLRKPVSPQQLLATVQGILGEGHGG
jgi:two-component system chemotaxis response regulator CheY